MDFFGKNNQIEAAFWGKNNKTGQILEIRKNKERKMKTMKDFFLTPGKKAKIYMKANDTSTIFSSTEIVLYIVMDFTKSENGKI